MIINKPFPKQNPKKYQYMTIAFNRRWNYFYENIYLMKYWWSIKQSMLFNEWDYPFIANYWEILEIFFNTNRIIPSWRNNWGQASVLNETTGEWKGPVGMVSIDNFEHFFLNLIKILKLFFSLPGERLTWQHLLFTVISWRWEQLSVLHHSPTLHSTGGLHTPGKQLNCGTCWRWWIHQHMHWHSCQW